VNHTKRVRFLVPEAELTHTKAFILSQGITARTWVDIMLTRLCCPHHPHPFVAHMGVDVDELLTSAYIGGAAEAEAHFDFRWETTLISLMDPGLELAEMRFSALLSATWNWAVDPGRAIAPPVAARLAAFASYWGGDAMNWAQVLEMNHGRYGDLVSPLELYVCEPFKSTRLPWVARIRGVRRG
jgi:hypothetical protein